MEKVSCLFHIERPNMSRVAIALMLILHTVAISAMDDNRAEKFLDTHSPFTYDDPWEKTHAVLKKWTLDRLKPLLQCVMQRNGTVLGDNKNEVWTMRLIELMFHDHIHPIENLKALYTDETFRLDEPTAFCLLNPAGYIREYTILPCLQFLVNQGMDVDISNEYESLLRA